MKIRINYAVEVDDWFREEINRHYGKPGLATRDEVKQWFEMYGSSMDDDLAMAAGERAERAQRYADAIS